MFENRVRSLNSPGAYGDDAELAYQAREYLRKNGWSILPGCSWLALDDDGNPCCKYGSQREHPKALGIAQFTLFDQRYVSEAIANWKENCPQSYTHACAPNVCPNRLTRLLNGIRR